MARHVEHSVDPPCDAPDVLWGRPKAIGDVGYRVSVGEAQGHPALDRVQASQGRFQSVEDLPHAGVGEEHRSAVCAWLESSDHHRRRVGQRTVRVVLPANELRVGGRISNGRPIVLSKQRSEERKVHGGDENTGHVVGVYRARDSRQRLICAHHTTKVR
jgi:hypothetical protein